MAVSSFGLRDAAAAEAWLSEVLEPVDEGSQRLAQLAGMHRLVSTRGGGGRNGDIEMDVTEAEWA